MENNNVIEILERIEKLLLSSKTSIPKTVLNLSETVEYTGLSRSHLYKLTSRNLIPFSKPSKQLYFEKTAIDAWLLRNRSKTNEEIVNEVITKSVIKGK